MISAVIIDDEESNRNNLINKINIYCPELNVVATAASVQEGYKVIQTHNPDLIFLDIEMPDGSGFDLLKLFPAPNFKVIFVSAFDQYAVKAIKMNALDYLLKPVDNEELIEAVSKSMEELASSQQLERMQNLIKNLQNPKTSTNKISIPSKNGYEMIEVNSIIRCEAEREYTWLVLVNGKRILVSRILKHFVEILEDYDFFRIHDAHLVSFAHIVSYQKGGAASLKMADGIEIEIARRRKPKVLEWLER